MSVHLVNPSNHSFGVATIIPRWLYVLAGATPAEFGDPVLTDEALHAMRPDAIQPGDVVGIGIHTSNALRGYEIGRMAAERGAHVVFGGIHATLYPDESFAHGAAHTVVKGDGEVAWGQALRDIARGAAERVYEGGRLPPESLSGARWDLVPRGRYLVGCVQTVRGCPKKCSFCSVWRTDGQQPRQRGHDAVVDEIYALRKLGFRLVLLADDNFYPVTLHDLEAAQASGDRAKLEELTAIREERFALLHAMRDLPPDMLFFTQITMEAAEDTAFLDAMNRAHVRFVLVGVESVSTKGLKAIRKEFNDSGETLVERLRLFPRHGVFVMGSFIFGLPTDEGDVFDATLDVADRSDVAFAQFLRLTPFPGTVDFMHWEKKMRAEDAVEGGRLARYWLIPYTERPKVQVPHPSMSSAELLAGTTDVWRRFYETRAVWRRSKMMPDLKSRLFFLLASKLLAQTYFHTGIASDSARAARAASWSGHLSRLTHRVIAWQAGT